MAVVIIALSVSGLLGSLVASIGSSVEHRSLTSLETVLKSFAESAKYDIQFKPSPTYSECASNYLVVGTPSPSSGPSGTAVTVFGTGFATTSALTVSLGPTALPGTSISSGGTTDSSGNAAVTFTIPTGFALGTYAVTLKDAANASATSTGNFVVTGGTAILTGSALAAYSVSIKSIQSWNGAAFASACSNNGIQQVTLVAIAKDHTSDSLAFVATNPATTSPAITSANNTTFTTGSPGAFAVTTSGLPTPSVSESGALPSGVTFSSATATLSGTPGATAGGVYNITFTASNSSPTGSATQSFTLTVNQAPAITSANNTTFTRGQPGTFTVTATGYPTVTLAESGALPNGVTFNVSTGVLAGTPTQTGSYTLTFTASNGVPPNASQTFMLTVNQAPAITSGNSTTFTMGRSGTFTVTATGVPAPTLSESGTLPSGVTFTAATGILAGTPTQTGSFPITFMASNGVAPAATQAFTLTVNQAPAITSQASTTFRTGQAGTFTVVATGVPAPTLSETGALPTGVTFTPATGVLAGTPASGTGGTYSLTFTATNGVNPNATQTFTLTVNQPPTITSASNTHFTHGTANSFMFTASGFPASTFTRTGGATLPAGVTLTPAGLLSGNPASSGIYVFTITASNGIAPNATQSFTLTVT